MFFGSVVLNALFFACASRLSNVPSVAAASGVASAAFGAAVGCDAVPSVGGAGAGSGVAAGGGVVGGGTAAAGGGACFVVPQPAATAAAATPVAICTNRRRPRKTRSSVISALVMSGRRLMSMINPIIGADNSVCYAPAVPPEEAYPKLISLAVHEFRTPANVVWGYLRMLQSRQDPPLTDQQMRLVNEAEKSFVRLIGLIDELSEVGKLDDGRTAMSRTPVDLFALAGEAAAGVHEGEDRGVRLEIRGDASGATMQGDAQRLQTAFASVFRSVLREKPRACTVVANRTVKGSGHTREAVIVVAEVEGLDAIAQATEGVFDDTRGGLGLALPIARRVIEAHGGRVSSPAGAAVVVFPLAST